MNICENKNKNKEGFTIIELIVVLSIISLMSSIVLSAVNQYTIKSRDVRRTADIQQLQKALLMYYADHGEFPSFSGWAFSGDANWTNLGIALASYMKNPPQDPTQLCPVSPPWAHPDCYNFGYRSVAVYGCVAKQYYEIVYNLEIASGPDLGGIGCDGSTVVKYGGAGANTKTKTVFIKAQ